MSSDGGNIICKCEEQGQWRDHMETPLESYKEESVVSCANSQKEIRRTKKKNFGQVDGALCRY
ncbi:hypothetical protein DPMN_157446 [Dreissena polymorpha]|uniref:Uncharacterized protein n=1 Tax=Dreissena polymorpha TaxID=45954 RepID=A0A9D4EH64_DREPO|nr:hypothetical protein DPMN_157446 [Dreissena polymorpha]